MMTTQEQRLSELLKRSVPEPPSELSADRVTVPTPDRSRGSWLPPALAAAAVVLVAAAGVGVAAMRHPSPATSAQREGQATLTPTAASSPAGPAEAPASFNPLVLPVNFGWLPAGFTENQPETGEFSLAGGQIGVTTTQASFGAGNTAGCTGFAYSDSTFATDNGVTWAIQADHSAAIACAGARMSKQSTGTVGMGFEQDTVAYLPTPLGPSGVKVLLPLFQFLGTNPANWTTNPFAN